jgi:hypothetical protein
LQVDVRTYLDPPCLAERLIFIAAIAGAPLGERSALDHIGKRLGVGAVRHAHEIVETLLRQTMDAGVLFQSLFYGRILLVILHGFIGGVSSTLDQLVRPFLAELQHDIDGELVGSNTMVPGPKCLASSFLISAEVSAFAFPGTILNDFASI